MAIYIRTRERDHQDYAYIVCDTKGEEEFLVSWTYNDLRFKPRGDFMGKREYAAWRFITGSWKVIDPYDALADDQLRCAWEDTFDL